MGRRYRNLTEYLESDRLRGPFDVMVVGDHSRRLEVPLKSDMQIRVAGQILEQLGRALQMTSRFRWRERSILMEAGFLIKLARQELKRGRASRKSTT